MKFKHNSEFYEDCINHQQNNVNESIYIKCKTNFQVHYFNQLS